MAKKAWIHMTGPERAAYKAAKAKGAGINGVIEASHREQVDGKAVRVIDKIKLVVAEEGFGRSWTQEQRDAVLRKVNAKPKA